MDTAIVKERLLAAAKRAGINATALALETGHERDYFRDFINGRKKSLSANAIALAARRLKVEPAWLQGGEYMYLDPDDPPPFAHHSPPPVLPVYKTAIDDDGHFVFDTKRVAEVACPPQLERVRAAYALQVNGESLEPRFHSGDTLYVDPSRAPRAQGPVVARIEIDGTLYGIIGAYVSSAKRLVIQPFRPAAKPRTFAIGGVKGIDVVRLIEI